jgi:asparagine synthase (glutamine-hydrolysing)
MCGICGFVNLDGAPADPGLLRRMTATLRHRGPDGAGGMTDGGAGLGHTRLSIIDLAGGAQPMQSADGSTSIVFNGEIFNYLELREELIAKGRVFASRSDTEVILQLYEEEGENCTERLNGQWAFAIWDARKRRLFLSRDRLGVRPLFYARTANSFYFASEIKALFACPDVAAGLDLRALDQIFTFWVTIPPRTAFENVCQLPPGHSLLLEGGSVRSWPYWRLDSCISGEENGADEGRVAAELLDLLQDATRIRLRSDVPVGAYLSGGIDSTLIAALAKRAAGDRLRTFSVAFEDPAFDESSYQSEASAYLETSHSSVRCSHDDIARDFVDVIRHIEQPVLRTAPVPLFALSRLVRAGGYKVVLTGEGADEIMGGYDIYKETKIRWFWGASPASSRRPLLLKRLYPYMDGLQRQSPEYLKAFFQVTPEALQNPFFSHAPRWDLTAKLKVFFCDELKAELGGSLAIDEMRRGLPERFGGWGAFRKAEYLETMHLLPGYILSSQGDRMAMAHSVEARYPFLDHRVVEFAAALPPRLKMKVLEEKHLLKKAAAGLIPEAIRRRYKQPYRAPDAKFCEHLNRELRDLLSPAEIRRGGVFDPKRVQSLEEKVRGGRAAVRDTMALVGILSVQVLLELFVHSRRGAAAGANR